MCLAIGIQAHSLVNYLYLHSDNVYLTDYQAAIIKMKN